jgi:tellurium resistance protein TerD
MPSFNLSKNGKFAIEKSISAVVFGLGWDIAPGKNADVDAHLFAVVPRPNGTPILYNDGSHALTYAAKAWLKVNPNGSFETVDGSLHHSGDDRTGGSGASGQPDESLTANLDRLPAPITELQLWITIHEPAGATFGIINNAFACLINKDTGVELCRYSLTQEYASSKSVQVGSLIKNNGIWTFSAIGAGVDVSLGDVLGKLS